MSPPSTKSHSSTPSSLLQPHYYIMIFNHLLAQECYAFANKVDARFFIIRESFLFITRHTLLKTSFFTARRRYLLVLDPETTPFHSFEDFRQIWVPENNDLNYNYKYLKPSVYTSPCCQQTLMQLSFPTPTLLETGFLFHRSLKPAFLHKQR